MGQVNSLANYRKPSTGEALTRAFQMYKDFQQGGESSSRSDLLDEQNQQLQDAAEREQNGVLTPKERLGLAASGKFSEFGYADSKEAAPKGSYTFKTTDEPDVTQFAIPKQPQGLRTPITYQDKTTGENKYGQYDPDSGITDLNGNPVDPNNVLAPKQPKSDTVLQAAAEVKAAQKNNDKQDKAFEHVQNSLEQMRGNPAVQQAEKDIYAAGKANSLINKLGGGDPNNLNPQAVSLLVQEVSKIASGGVPTQHELDILTPSTLDSKFASIKQKLLGEPSPANAGEFLKQYKDYADSLTDDAQKTITDRYGRILESNKSRLPADGYDTLKANYLDRFKNAAQEAKATADKEKSASGFGVANAAPAGFKPGSIIERGGKRFQVGADGKSATEVQ